MEELVDNLVKMVIACKEILIAIFSAGSGYWLGIKKGKRLEAAKIELDQLYKLEGMVGETVEWAKGYQSAISDLEFTEMVSKLNRAVGTFSKHSYLCQAIRDLSQYVMIIVDGKRKHEDTREYKIILEEKYKSFIAELEKVRNNV